MSWGSGRGLLEVYQGWTDAASAGGRGLLEVYWGWTDAASAGIWKRFIRSLSGVEEVY